MSSLPMLGLAAGLLAVPALVNATGPLPHPDKLGPALARRLSDGVSQTVVAWVFFADRAGAERDAAALEAARRGWSRRGLERRRLRGTLRDLTVADLPVHPAYIRALQVRGLHVRGASRWLNAASVEGPAGDVAAIARLQFVARIELVPRGQRLRDVIEPGASRDAARLGARASDGPAPVLDAAPGETAFYGGAYRQLSMMQVPALHTYGLTGHGVLVAMLDGGFRTTHRAFAGLTVVARRDFVHQDSIVDDEPGQDTPGAAGHGTATLGCVAALMAGTYSGGAFGVSVALAKTEDTASETPVEMDFWQFGAEWADSLGADVISCSLGYSEFDNPADSYTYADMDGRTTVVALAAAEAARRGITVLTAAGNEGAVPWHYIVSPGDADTVITLGAVDSNNVVTSFSSRGPTSDGRTKPDVTAMGRMVLLVSFGNDSGYTRASGTSFSTPLTAGVVALLLEAHPAWGPYEVREALRETASNHSTPDNNNGWGLVQGQAAYGWRPSTVDAPAPAPAPSTTLALSVSPNPWPGDGVVTVRFSLPEPATCRIQTVDLTGRSRATRELEHVSGTQTLRLLPMGDDGARLAPGVYWIRLEARTGSGSRSISRRLVVTS